MSRCVMVALAARVIRSSGVGFEPYGAEVVSCRETYVRVQGGGQATDVFTSSTDAHKELLADDRLHDGDV